MLCARCILPDTMPGISFDERGLCTLCQQEPPVEVARERRAALRSALEDVYATVRGKHDYDCIVAYSGGKDSSYTLWTLKERYGLRCLAVTVDNGFLSEQAFSNIRVLTDAWGIDHLFYKPAFSFMKTLYAESLKGGLHAGAAVKRASAVCNSCISLINNYMLKCAYQMGVPLIAGGYLGGQVPKDAALFEFKLAAMTRGREAGLKRYVERFGEANARHFFALEASAAASGLERVFITNPMLVLDVDEATVLSALRAHGWVRPADTGVHSSNCRLNDLGIYTHLRQHGFHPYVAELAEQVRVGLMGRDEALARIGTRVELVQLRSVAQKLGVEVDAL